MLGFGLTLLGGCVSPPDAGGNRLCYFPAHSVTPKKVLQGFMNARNAASQENMAASAHFGYFSAENIVKKGTRAAGQEWGVITDAVSDVNTFTLSLSSRQGAAEGAYRTHVQAAMGGNIFLNSNVIYESGADLTASFFTLKIKDGECSVDSGFSSVVIQNPLRDIIADPSRRVYVYKYSFINLDRVSYDFVVSSYRNDGLGVNILTLPMRSAPPSFTTGAVAIFEFFTHDLKEL